MSLCGQSPLYVPTTVNAVLRNIDAVDCAATSISCKNLTVDGEPVSTAVQNMLGTTLGNTVFKGDVKADSIQSTGTLKATGFATLSGLSCAGIDNSSYLNVAGPSALDGACTFGSNIIQNTGSASLKTTSTTGLTNTGALTQTGDITQNSGNASLKTTSVTGLTNTGALTQTGAATFATNITQNAGTASLKDVTATSLSVSSGLTFTNLTVTGTAIFSKSGISCTPSHIVSGSIPNGTNATALLGRVTTGYPAYRIYWNGVGCSGNFTPRMSLGKFGASTGSTTYHSTTHGNTINTSTSYIVLNGSSSGLGNGELMTGQLTIWLHPTISKLWMFEGFSVSNQAANGWKIYGTMTDGFADPGWDSVSFEVSQGTLSNSAATYQIEPLLQ